MSAPEKRRSQPHLAWPWWAVRALIHGKLSLRDFLVWGVVRWLSRGTGKADVTTALIVAYLPSQFGASGSAETQLRRVWDRLERRGLITRTTRPGHRTYTVHLTDLGRWEVPGGTPPAWAQPDTPHDDLVHDLVHNLVHDLVHPDDEPYEVEPPPAYEVPDGQVSGVEPGSDPAPPQASPPTPQPRASEVPDGQPSEAPEGEVCVPRTSELQNNREVQALSGDEEPRTEPQPPARERAHAPAPPPRDPFADERARRIRANDLCRAQGRPLMYPDLADPA